MAILADHLWSTFARSVAMARKPYFRTFDGWWYAQVRVGAKRKQIKLVKGKEKEQEAYQAFCRLVADHDGDAPAPRAITVAVLSDLFLDHSQKHHKPDTFALYKHFLQDFCDLHGRKMAAEIKPFHVSRWLDGHATWKGCRPNAIASVKRAFAWASAEGLLDKNPIQSVKKPATGKRDRIVSKEERDEILTAIKDEEFRNFVIAMQETGCRPSEVARVTAADVNLEVGVWVFQKHKTAGKTNRPRVVYLTTVMLELTRKLIAKYPGGPLFRGPRGGRPFSRNGIRCRFRRLRAKLPHLAGVVSYSYRHTWATEALVNGVGIAQVAELMGHTSTEMVSTTYGHLADKLSHLREAAQKAISG
ncbi:MAG: site-specific integrase [Planctomycetes bacterium]|nr:site-specific integrase [Planctomycetota bacterium]